MGPKVSQGAPSTPGRFPYSPYSALARACYAPSQVSPRGCVGSGGRGGRRGKGEREGEGEMGPSGGWGPGGLDPCCSDGEHMPGEAPGQAWLSLWQQDFYVFSK